MKKIAIVIALLFFFSPQILKSQTTDFSTDGPTLLKQLTDLLKEPKREDCNDAAAALEKNWTFWDETNLEDISNIANLMKGRKMLVYPYFLNFANALNAYAEAGISKDVFEDWQHVLSDLINGSKQGNNNEYGDFLSFSTDFFKNNALYTSAGKTWQSTSGNYQFKYENGKPSVYFEQLDLIAYTKGDTITIRETEGTYYPLEDIWHGVEGTVDWSRAGLDSSFVYVKFGKYTIDCSQSDYSVDSAKLFYQGLLEQDVLGKFSDKVLIENTAETTSYPRFQSYNHHITLNNLSDKVTFTGGISIEGNKMNGTGDGDQKAVVTIKRYDDKVGVIARSNSFQIKNFEEIISSDAEVSLFLGTDSIYHAGLSFRYKMTPEELTLLRGDVGISKSAFNDSYHGMEIYTDAIKWTMTDPVVNIQMITGAGKTPVTMESKSYFEKQKLDKYKNISDFNIINQLKKYVDKNAQQKTIDANSFAKFMNSTYTVETIRRTLFKLVEDGFIYYDQGTETITVRPKTLVYVQADQKLIDYDDIKIESTTDTINASIDLTNYKMGINGVKSILLSDSNFVVIFPDKDSLFLEKDRDISFGGSLFAGHADIFGKGFLLHYQDWKMDLEDVDSMMLNIPTGNYDQEGNKTVGPIKSTIERFNGTLQIDNKTNKSGKKRNWNMPVITSPGNAYVFYDHRNSNGGVYNRQNFFFEMDPFVFDSLNCFSPLQIKFPGKLVSAGIFPDIKETVTLQPDLSLGFKTTQSGLSLYGNLGTYTDKISLDNSGLRGKGNFQFLTSNTQSQDIIFFPDSLNAQADSFTVARGNVGGIDFPNIKGANDYVHWTPHSDSMLVKMKEQPFQLFGTNTYLKGNVVLTSRGSAGDGTVDWPEAKLTSRNVQFGLNRMDADTADFSIKSIDSTKFALSTTNVEAHIDFDKRFGNFVSNTDDISTEFPYNQYRTSINEFDWDMDKKLMHFKAPAGTEADFTSVNPTQDSLTFTGTSAIYNLQDFLLKVNGVEQINVADAIIFPDSNKVVIEPQAVMRPLFNSKIEADTLNGFHHWDSCTVVVFGKQNFKGRGYYHFTTKSLNEKIYFNDISVTKDDHKDLHTYGKATIDTADHFLLTPKIEFKGKANVTATSEPINFDGYAKLQLKNPNVKAEWFSVTNEFTTDSTFIYYNNPQNEYKKPVTTGIVFYSDSSDLYTSFFNPKRSTKDRNVFIANGIVYYDEDEKAFIAGDYDKINNGVARGNMIKYYDATAKVYAEGSLDFGLNFGLVNVKAAGIINTDLIKNEYNLNTELGLTFDLDKNLLEMLAKAVFDANNYLAEPIDYTTEDFQKTIMEFVNPKDEKKFNDGLNKDGTIPHTDDFKQTIFFTDLHLKWDKTSKSFYSVGPIGIAFIGEKPVNLLVNGAYLEIGYKKSGDYMNLYIPCGEDNWYFFNYTNNQMQIISGDQVFNQALVAIDPDKRRTKSDDGKIYQYNPGTVNKKNTFVEKMKFLQNPTQKK